jgi:hypothetical protein
MYDYCMDELRHQPFYGRFTEEIFVSANEVVEPITCQSCSARVSELFPCEWDADLLVGACCVVPDDSPDVAPACPVRRHIMDTVVTAGAMCDLLKAHEGAKCAHCESAQETALLAA